MSPSLTDSEELQPLTADMELNHSDPKMAEAQGTICSEYTDDSRGPRPFPSNDSRSAEPLEANAPSTDNGASESYRVYKRRFFGLAHLTLLNIIVSWCWLTFAPVSTTTSEYFGVSQNGVNWLSTGFLFAFVVASPFTMWTLNRGIKPAMIVASALLLVGNWIRYAGTKAGGGPGGRGTFGVVVFGQVVIGFAQPFVLAAPTRYSDLWFSQKGRITATALASLANPFGGALGQLIDPFWATKPDEIPNMVLYIAIITTVLTIPALFLPSAPPTPPTATSLHKPPTLNLRTLLTLLRSPSFHLIAWPFTIYVSAFNATSSLINQILHPYGFSQTNAGIDGAILIVAGLVFAALLSPLLDRTKRLRFPAVKLLVPVIAAMYVALIFAPRTRTVAAPFAVSAVLGAASFALLPLALELLVEVTWPVGPEVSSTVCWAAGQLGGGVFILVMDALKGGVAGQPEHGMYRALVFQAVMACLVVPLPMVLGSFGTGREKRVEMERERTMEAG